MPPSPSIKSDITNSPARMPSLIPRKNTTRGDLNKRLPALPSEPRTPQALPYFGRSFSHAVLPRVTPATAPVIRQRDTSFDLTMFRQPELGKKETDSDNICKISSYISSPASRAPDDPELFESSAWWAGRYMSVSDRLRGEMPYSTQEERDRQACKEMNTTCGGDPHKERVLQIWWINFRMKESDEQAQGKGKTRV
ncbi:hypothetical protein DRE_07472 [Drechslerella stenobrocha 248]|uniref:Uncharacterized protein n=1 Tax=Drechslerella stenobrocha 248 TaxID=1043628 RepID=W7I4R1_9PEZI|nr:hypothetical protein DRE_07472 [Drechslerella stenobrocha 248]